MVNPSRINFLLTQYTDGTISRSDYDELMGLLRSDRTADEFLPMLEHLFQQQEEERYHTAQEEELIFQKLLTAKSKFVKRNGLVTVKAWMKYAAAAAVFFILSIGVYLFTIRQSGFEAITGKSIAPARDKAYLLTTNGSRINLDNLAEGKILKQEGVNISKSSDGFLTYTISQNAQVDEHKENSIVTPKGGHFQINLPDGTKVWLNAESKLTFPVKFSGQSRTVRLQGEAYFEVAKSYLPAKAEQGKKTRLPFYVLTSNQRVEVLGTHFNVHAYQDERFVSTTLLEGAVALSLIDKKGISASSAVLKPGQQGVNNGTQIKIKQVDTEEQMGWKNGLFILNGQNLAAIMKEVSRWYDVDVVFQNESLKQHTFSGSISRFKDISALFEVLESTGSVHFTIEGRRVFVEE